MVRTTLIAAAALAAAAPVGAEVVETSDDHFVTRDSVVVEAEPRAVWLELITPAGWWDDEHTWSGSGANMSITPQGGGCFCERIPANDTLREVGLEGSVRHMTVILAQPMSALRMRGGLGPLQSEPVDGVLTFAMQPDKASGGTKLTMEYVVGGHMRYEVPVIAAKVDEVMSLQLGRLADKLGRVGAPAAAAKPAPKDQDKTAPPSDEEATSASETESVEDALDAMDAGKPAGKKTEPKPR